MRPFGMLLMAAIAAAAFALPVSANAACQCDCSAACVCGETCKTVKHCKIIKKCWNTKSCSKEKKVPKCSAGHKDLVCHIPPGNTANAHTLCVDNSAVAAHLAHGDYLGPCQRCSDYCTTKKCCRKVVECACDPCAGPPECPPCVCHDAGSPSDSGLQPDLYASDAGDEPGQDLGGDTQSIPDKGAQDAGTQIVDAEPPLIDSASRIDAQVSPHPDTGPGPDQGFDGGVPDLEIVESDGSCGCPDGFKEEPKRRMEMLGSGGCSMGGSGSIGGALLVAALFGLAFVARRRTWLAIAVLIGALSGSSPAMAAPDLPPSHLVPSVGFGNYYQTVSPETSEHGRITLGAFYNYEHRPIQILWQDTGKRVTSVVKYRHNLDLMVAMGLGNRFEVELGAPFILAQGTRGLDLLGGPEGEFADGGVGDIRLSGKFRAWSKGAFSCGASSLLVLPTSSDAEAFGEGGAMFAPSLLAELTSKHITGAINAGFVVRSGGQTIFHDQRIASGTDFTASLAVRIPLWRERLDFLGDGFMSMNLEEQDREEVPFEALAGLRAYLPNGVSVDVGGGPGLTKGLGTPRFRLFAGVSWSPRPERVRTRIVRVECDECDRPVINRPPPVVVDTRISIQESRVRLDPVYFETDDDEIMPQSIPTLQANLNLLLKHDWIRKVAIVGHADWRASDDYNMALGMARALGVLNLLKAGGVNPSRMVPYSEGEKEPQATNKTDAGMAQNRRVEFLILKPKDGIRKVTRRNVRVLKGDSQ